MKIDEFLEQCKDVAATWRINESGAIEDCACRCPIVAVAEAFYVGTSDDNGISVPEQCGRSIGLRKRQVFSIMSAADCITDTPLRRRLLKACGLEKT